jgi:hypothetical protein
LGRFFPEFRAAGAVGPFSDGNRKIRAVMAFANGGVVD